MRMKLCYFLFLPIFLSFLLASCTLDEQTVAPLSFEVNLDHLNSLYEERILPSEDTIGYLYRTSRPPLWEPSGIPGEGIASVDDAARAVIVYMRHHRRTGRDSSLVRGRHLLRFLLFMQHENGYFHNYYREDGSINDTILSGIAAPRPWSWHALWAIGEGLEYLPENDPLYNDLLRRRNRLLRALRIDLPNTDTTMRFGGLQLPTWLPRQNDANQASLLMPGLLLHYRQTGSTATRDLLNKLAKGIRMMQVDNQGAYPTGAFLSYRNVWRAAHHLQGYALLAAAETLETPASTRAALRELDQYHPRLLQKGFVGQWIYEKNVLDTFDLVEEAMFPQGPADFRPVIWATIKAYQITGARRFLDLAQSYARWFAGDNAAGIQIYDSTSGRGLAGLDETGRAVEEASAAATLEALLAVQALMHPEEPL